MQPITEDNKQNVVSTSGSIVDQLANDEKKPGDVETGEDTMAPEYINVPDDNEPQEDKSEEESDDPNECVKIHLEEGDQRPHRLLEATHNSKYMKHRPYGLLNTRINRVDIVYIFTYDHTNFIHVNNGTAVDDFMKLVMDYTVERFNTERGSRQVYINRGNTITDALASSLSIPIAQYFSDQINRTLAKQSTIINFKYTQSKTATHNSLLQFTFELYQKFFQLTYDYQQTRLSYNRNLRNSQNMLPFKQHCQSNIHLSFLVAPLEPSQEKLFKSMFIPQKFKVPVSPSPQARQLASILYDGRSDFYKEAYETWHTVARERQRLKTPKPDLASVYSDMLFEELSKTIEQYKSEFNEGEDAYHISLEYYAPTKNIPQPDVFFFYNLGSNFYSQYIETQTKSNTKFTNLIDFTSLLNKNRFYLQKRYQQIMLLFIKQGYSWSNFCSFFKNTGSVEEHAISDSLLKYMTDVNVITNNISKQYYHILEWMWQQVHKTTGPDTVIIIPDYLELYPEHVRARAEQAKSFLYPTSQYINWERIRQIYTKAGIMPKTRNDMFGGAAKQKPDPTEVIIYGPKRHSYSMNLNPDDNDTTVRPEYQQKYDPSAQFRREPCDTNNNERHQPQRQPRFNNNDRKPYQSRDNNKYGGGRDQRGGFGNDRKGNDRGGFNKFGNNRDRDSRDQRGGNKYGNSNFDRQPRDRDQRDQKPKNSYNRFEGLRRD